MQNNFYNQHFDVHGDDDGGGDGYGGCAGTYFVIANNTIRGEQKYGVLGLGRRGRRLCCEGGQQRLPSSATMFWFTTISTPPFR
jgi:hypothetical protein